MLILDFLAPLLQLFLKNANLSTLLPPRDPPAPAEPHLKVSWSAAPEGSVLIHPPALATTKMLSSLLQSRRNWIDDPDALSRIMELCGQIVRNLGLRVDDIDAITRADMVQISFPVPTVDGQDFPWEFVLAEATRQRGLRTSRLPEQTLLVVRHMPPPVIGGPKARKRRSAPPDTASFSAPEKLLFVKSAPGRLADLYEFESEQRLISSSLNLLSQPIVLSDPNAISLSLWRDFIRRLTRAAFGTPFSLTQPASVATFLWEIPGCRRRSIARLRTGHGRAAARHHRQ